MENATARSRESRGQTNRRTCTANGAAVSTRIRRRNRHRAALCRPGLTAIALGLYWDALRAQTIPAWPVVGWVGAGRPERHAAGAVPARADGAGPRGRALPG